VEIQPLGCKSKVEIQPLGCKSYGNEKGKQWGKDLYDDWNNPHKYVNDGKY